MEGGIEAYRSGGAFQKGDIYIHLTDVLSPLAEGDCHVAGREPL